MIEHSEETWANHEAILRQMQGGEQVIGWYGDAPGFHDAEIGGLVLRADGSGSLSVRFWRLKPTSTDGRVLEPVDERMIIFSCEQIVDMQLESFGPRTSLNALQLQRAKDMPDRPRFSLAEYQPGDVDLLIEPHYGLSGWLRCRGLRVEVQPLE